MKKLGWYLTIILALLPMLYLITVNLSMFSSLLGATYGLGRAFGLSGMVLFGITMFMNTRFLFIEKMFGGLDKVYKAHHWFGTLSFALLVFHPLFLAYMYATTSLSSAFYFLLPSSNISINLGIFALFFMFVFLGFTFLVKLKYHTWKFTHQFLGVAFIIASLHVLLISSDVNRNILLKVYMLIFIALGIFAFAYRTLFWKAWVKRYDYVIRDVKVFGNVTDFVFEPLEKGLTFVPGQFVFLSIQKKGFSEPHPFSISTSVRDKNLGLAAKKLGDHTNLLPSIKAGTHVKIEGPYGMFCPSRYSNKNQVWIAGGIGVTPFLSMVRSLDVKEERSITLYYAIMNKRDALYLDELDGISKKIKNYKLITYFQDSQGYLNIEYISKNSKDFKNSEIFICGPPAMMNSLKKQALGFGIPKSHIHMEDFSL